MVREILMRFVHYNDIIAGIALGVLLGIGLTIILILLDRSPVYLNSQVPEAFFP